MTDHKGQTDELTEVELPSTIEQVQWTQWIASPGGTVGLEVFTKYVGNNAELEVEVKDGGGGSYVIKSQITNNAFIAFLPVPASAEKTFDATVKLPKHSLTKKAQTLPLTAPFSISKAKWDRPIACRGDVLPLVATVKGLNDGTDVTISVWQHDPEGAHERITFFQGIVSGGKVEADWAFDYKGPLDVIVERDAGPVQFFYRVERNGVFAESNLIKFIWIAIELVGEDGVGIPSQRYGLRLPDGSQRVGRLDLDGRAIEDGIPKEGECRVSFLDLDMDAWGEAE